MRPMLSKNRRNRKGKQAASRNERISMKNQEGGGGGRSCVRKRAGESLSLSSPPRAQIGFPFVRESPRFGQRCIPPRLAFASRYTPRKKVDKREERAAREAEEEEEEEERDREEKGGGASLFDSWGRGGGQRCEPRCKG